MRKIFGGVLLAAAVAAGSVDAEPNDTAKWLMNEPVTLWDRGIDVADAEAERIARALGKPRGTGQVGWAYYDYANNEINIGMRIEGYESLTAPTHEDCNEIRWFFVNNLNAWYSAAHDEQAQTEALYKSVSHWFTHRGFSNTSRDEDIGKKLARMIYVRVVLLNKEGSIQCRDRITSLDAPSKPLN